MLHAYSDQSIASRDVFPATLLACSSSVGWRSLLVRHSRSLPTGEICETRSTPDQLLVVTLRGALNMESFADGRWRKAVLQAGSVGATAPGEVDRLRFSLRHGAESFDKLHMFIPAGLLAEAAEHFRRAGRPDPAGPVSCLAFRDGALAAVGDALLAAVHAGAPDLYAETTAHWLAAHLVASRAGSGELDDGRRPGAITDARLARALEYMSAHLAEEISLDALAVEAGASKFHFVRLFREQLGETPIRYLTSLRLKTAARLLTTSDLPVGQIARECGFSDHARFSGVFRRRYGRSPERHRRAR